MKKTLLYTLLFITAASFSQTYFTRTGSTNFKASVAAFEPVEATNNSTTVILKTNSGELAAQLFVTAFQFKVALMQEHFNENYMDANKFPKAIFRGKITDFKFSEIGQEKTHPLSGTLTVRGIQKEISTTAKMLKTGEKIHIDAVFSVSPQDFKIDIPNIVRKKIAEKINIHIHYELIEKK